MRKLFLANLLCLASLAIKAQGNRDLIKGDTLYLVSPIDVTITDAKRKPTPPVLETPQVQAPVLEYNLTLKSATVPAKIEIPVASKMDKAVQPVYKNNYIRLGFGNYVTPLADIYITMPGTKGILGFNFNHLSSNGPAFADFSSNRGGINGKKFYKKGNLEAGLTYGREGMRFYGYNPELVTPTDKKQIEQFYQLIGANLAWEAKPMGRNKNYYRFESKYYNFQDKFKQQENDVEVKGLYAFKVKEQRLEIGGGYNLQQFKNDSIEFNRNFINLDPNYVIRRKLWELNLGFVSTIILQPGEDANVKFFPRVEGSYQLDENNLSVFGGFTGGVRKNSFRNFATENPFIAYNPDLSITVNRFEFKAGIKGKLGSNTGFVTRVIYHRFNDLPLFITDTLPERRFIIVHDDVQLVRLNAEINHQYSEKFRMSIAFNLYNYKPNLYEKAWQLPNLDLKVNGTYNIGDKLLFSMDLFMIGKRFAYTQYSAEAPVELKQFFDANLGLEYRWKKQISAFVRLNNLAASKYQYWSNYPVYGFNGMAGLTIGF